MSNVVESRPHRSERKPFDLTKAVIVLCLPFVGVCVWVFVRMVLWAQEHVAALVPWLWGAGVLLVIAGVTVIGFKVYHIRLNALMHRLEVDERAAAVEWKRETTRALTSARTSGHSHKVYPDGTLEVITAQPVRVQEVQEQMAPPAPLALPAPDDALPGYRDFADILTSWRPDPEHILLALGPSGTRHIVPVKSLVHGALAGATGLGKSVIMRLLLAQLIYVGANVLLADPHYADIDPESGEDWRPIRQRLCQPPLVRYPDIKRMLEWLATEELPARLERRRTGQPIGVSYFLAMDELPAIVNKIPECPEYMAEILREGRKVKLYLVTAAQDFLVKTIGGSGAVRDCFRTAFYVGGDATTARVLLDVKGAVDDGGLGKGIVLLRSAATPKAALARVPYVSNESLIDLLTFPGTPRGTAGTVSGTLRNTGSLVHGQERLADMPESVPVQERSPEPSAQIAVSDEDREHIIELREDGVPRREICARMKKGKWFYSTVQQVCDEEGL